MTRRLTGHYMPIPSPGKPCRAFVPHPLPEENLEASLPLIRKATERALSHLKQAFGYRSEQALGLWVWYRKQEGEGERVTQTSLIEKLARGERCWLEGPPGAGKTWLVLGLAEQILNKEGRRLPIVVSLRGWAQTDRSLLEYIASQPSFAQEAITITAIARAAEAGRLVLLLNGWNEVGSERVEPLLRQLELFLGQTPGATALITSRPVRHTRPCVAAKHLALQPWAHSNSAKRSDAGA